MKPRITEESNDKSKIWKLTEINEPSQCRSLRLPDNMRVTKVWCLLTLFSEDLITYQWVDYVWNPALSFLRHFLVLWLVRHKCVHLDNLLIFYCSTTITFFHANKLVAISKKLYMHYNFFLGCDFSCLYTLLLLFL